MKPLTEFTQAELIDEVERLRDIITASTRYRSYRRYETSEKDQRCFRVQSDTFDLNGKGFDEIVVGEWLHIEQLSGGDRKPNYFVRIGNRVFNVTASHSKVRVMYEGEPREGYVNTEWRDE